MIIAILNLVTALAQMPVVIVVVCFHSAAALPQITVTISQTLTFLTDAITQIHTFIVQTQAFAVLFLIFYVNTTVQTILVVVIISDQTLIFLDVAINRIPTIIA